jgi:hypothetical protein
MTRRNYKNNPDGPGPSHFESIYAHRHASRYDREVAREYRRINENMTPGARAAKAWRKSAHERKKKVTLASTPFDWRKDDVQ